MTAARGVNFHQELIHLHARLDTLKTERTGLIKSTV